MAKFLIQGSYSAEGAKGLIKEGGTGRRAAIEKSLEGLGGKLESFYFTYGTNDVNVICDIPDAVSRLALSWPSTRLWRREDFNHAAPVR